MCIEDDSWAAPLPAKPALTGSSVTGSEHLIGKHVTELNVFSADDDADINGFGQEGFYDKRIVIVNEQSDLASAVNPDVEVSHQRFFDSREHLGGVII